MLTRFTVQYWYIDEHDTIENTFDTLPEALKYASQINLTIFKDITIYGQHFHKVSESFNYNGINYTDFHYEQDDDDYIEYYNKDGVKC